MSKEKPKKFDFSAMDKINWEHYIGSRSSTYAPDEVALQKSGVLLFGAEAVKALDMIKYTHAAILIDPNRTYMKLKLLKENAIGALKLHDVSNKKTKTVNYSLSTLPFLQKYKIIDSSVSKALKEKYVLKFHHRNDEIYISIEGVK